MQVIGESDYKLEASDTSKCNLLLEIVANKTTGEILHLKTINKGSSLIPA
jgi:hypothetical protein